MHRAGWSWSTALRSAARGQGTLLIIDDLQWVDPSTVALLRHLLDQDDPADLSIVLGMRDDAVPEFLREWLDEEDEKGRVRNLPLRKLEPDESEALARALLVRWSLTTDRELIARVRAFSDGNPYFVTEQIGRAHV